MRVHVSAHCKPDTAAGYRSVLEKHLLPELGAMAITEVGGAEVSALHYRLRDTPVRANAAVDLLSRIFSLAELWELTPPGRNPCRGLRRYRTRPRERFLTDEEFGRLGRALKDAEAEGGIWPPAVAALRLLMLTGSRRSEILNLRWDDVDRTAGELRLCDAKTGPRMVPLTTPALRVLDGIPRSLDNPWVIPGQRNGDRLLNLYHYWEPVRARAGLPDVRIHDLRHSYASPSALCRLRRACRWSGEVRALRAPFVPLLGRAPGPVPLYPPRYTVVELATGEDLGTWDSWEEVAMCLAFAKLSQEEVEVITDQSALATMTGY